MSDLVFQEIAMEIKGLHNGAMQRLASGLHDEAEELYLKCLQLTELISYHEGSAMTLFGLANLACLTDNLPLAIARAHEARSKFLQADMEPTECDRLLATLATAARKRGVELERKRRFADAIVLFEAALPHSDGKVAAALRHETALLKRIIHEGN